MYEAQDKWKKKSGYKSCAFFAYACEFEAFKEACKLSGKGISETLRELITEYAEENGVDIETCKLKYQEKLKK